MDRLAAAILIALAALVMNGGLVHDAMAGEAGLRLPAAATIQKTQMSAATSPRSERVLSLLLALAALQAAPALLDAPKV